MLTPLGAGGRAGGREGWSSSGASVLLSYSRRPARGSPARASRVSDVSPRAWSSSSRGGRIRTFGPGVDDAGTSPVCMLPAVGHGRGSRGPDCNADSVRRCNSAGASAHEFHEPYKLSERVCLSAIGPGLSKGLRGLEPLRPSPDTPFLRFVCSCRWVRGRDGTARSLTLIPPIEPPPVRRAARPHESHKRAFGNARSSVWCLFQLGYICNANGRIRTCIVCKLLPLGAGGRPAGRGRAAMSD